MLCLIVLLLLHVLIMHDLNILQISLSVYIVMPVLCNVDTVPPYLYTESMVHRRKPVNYSTIMLNRKLGVIAPFCITAADLAFEWKACTTDAEYYAQFLDLYVKKCAFARYLACVFMGLPYQWGDVPSATDFDVVKPTIPKV